MGITTHKRFIIVMFALFTLPQMAAAQIVITEIMYDLPVGSDSGREWIEVYNAGPTAVDLTKFKLFENGTNHKITAAAGGSVLPPASYAVIADNAAKFKTDWPNYSAVLFDSAFALGNEGDTLELRDASSTVLDTASFTSALGAAGDGNSLNRASANDSLTPHTPSPGASMSADIIQLKVKIATAPKVAPKKCARCHLTQGSYDAEEPTIGDAGAPAQVAAAATTVTPTWEWWLAAALLAAASAGAIIFARRYAKDEWDIVEE